MTDGGQQYAHAAPNIPQTHQKKKRDHVTERGGLKACPIRRFFSLESGQRKVVLTEDTTVVFPRIYCVNICVEIEEFDLLEFIS